MNKSYNNPWLKISAQDYEGHMSDLKVGQFQALNKIFYEAIKKYSPESLCVLGCTTGNGFEHINAEVIKKVVGVDINEEYLKILSERYLQNIPGLELICGDLNEIVLQEKSFDLIYAALIFEYIDVEKALENISRWLKKNGILSVILQMQSESTSSVSETKYESLKILSPVINLLNVDDFRMLANRAGLREVNDFEYDLKTGKKFFVGEFCK